MNKSVTNGAYNYQLQYFSPHKRPTHLFRVDYQTTTLYYRGTHFQTGVYHGDLSNVVFSYDDFVYPGKQASFGWTHLVSPPIVNEFTTGVRRPHEETFADDNRGYRKTYNLTLGQFHPEINYADLLPLVSLSRAACRTRPVSAVGKLAVTPNLRVTFSIISRTASPSAGTSTPSRWQRFSNNSLWEFHFRRRYEQPERFRSSIRQFAAGQFRQLYGIDLPHPARRKIHGHGVVPAGLLEGDQEADA